MTSGIVLHLVAVAVEAHPRPVPAAAGAVQRPSESLGALAQRLAPLPDPLEARLAMTINYMKPSLEKSHAGSTPQVGMLFEILHHQARGFLDLCA
jgi:hypothetical protein